MRVVVTGSSGHLGEALVRTLRASGCEVAGLDLVASPHTDVVGSIADPEVVRSALEGATAVLHTATLHKPHIVTHSRRQFVDTNVTGTLTLLEEAVRIGVRAFVFTSSTSVFGDALKPPAGSPAAWITEDVVPVPKNIYGITKIAAENLCELFNRKHGLACVVLRTSRFFPDADDDRAVRREFADANVKTNELLFRRVDIADVAEAHLLALERAPALGFDRFIVSATTPFRREDLAQLRREPEAIVEKHVPAYRAVYEGLGWRMFRSIDRVYVNERARHLLGWQPTRDFGRAIACLADGADPRSELARAVGVKGYHSTTFEGGVYPVE